MPQIVGPDGKPFSPDYLTEEIAGPSLTAVRQVWTDSIARGLTPAKLAQLLQSAVEGNADDFLTLAEEMEERDPHYAAVLATRRLAVSGLTVKVEAASEDAADVKLAEFVREQLVEDACFTDVVGDLMDALGKSYSVIEIIWQTGKVWKPRCYEWRDPRWFTFDRDTRRELRLRDSQFPLDGKPLAPFKFIAHRPRIKTGLPIRNALARIVALTWLCKSYAQKDWMAFAEIFGIPLRLGRYGPNASADDVRILARAVANIGSDASAVLPDSMKIEFQKVEGTGDGALFAKLCEYLDKQISKAVLGQTMTTDDGASMSQAKVHDKVRGDILQDDAKKLSGTLNRDLVRAAIDLNFGPQERYPRIVLHIEEAEDLQLLSESLAKLVPLGFRVSQDEVRNKFGLSEPKDKDEIFRQQAAPALPVDGAADAQGKVALNAAQQPRDRIDELVEAEIGDWHEQLDEILTPVERLAAECADEAEFLRRLPELKIEAAKLQQALAVATFKARGLGDATDNLQAG